MTVLLHGFWGQPMDWNQVLQRLPLGEPVWMPDLYAEGPLSPGHRLEQWTDSFLQQVRARSESPVQLVGYSMGGRLALNAAVRGPLMFSRVLILSAAPFSPAPDGGERERWEQSWAERFAVEDWDALEAGWQEQPVLNTSQPLQRRRSPELRERLALSLINWSVRHHDFTAAEVKALPRRFEWAFGALDQKYLGFARLLQEIPVRGRINIIPNAGHRLPQEAAEFIAEWIQRG